ncbi:PREDICTED: basement membrane-specific heparan sulfate proteoglycan core protein [Dufourea novaeangliae]|uniref:basement membrane-specific heparan sulfate proteoglycan core protein n=1 Tax=Dufourea novaeangliae TaxID=178035 RepID=UPI0007670CAE|nr:PREDICTED: basement membrane-specific heparan sulfate proteoglycan core protein [Dufourea novaeangliae]
MTGILFCSRRPKISDNFKSKVTLDIGSTYTDELEVRSTLEEQLRYHALGSIQVYPDEFTFRIFQAGTEREEEECDPSTELTCRNGACVPLDSRCDGVTQCDDGSDELDCPGTTTHPYPGTEEPEVETTVREELPDRRTASNKCRADDTVRCHDESRYICSVQQCDGVPDCDDGGDEVGCPHPGCSAGEFACDVSRCILESERCNFIENCRDGSDEHDCNYPACTSIQFKCGNGQCIDSGAHCNGVEDCHDGTDELNCPCTDDEFECTPGYCLKLSKRCDGFVDCNGGMDEANCLNMTRCRPDEFECASGNCVSKNARCDGRLDCPDHSDEYNCNVTTCSGDQFRCLDGTCLSIDKRCNHVIDCRNGEDESQCGCGVAEFRCTDGRCIGYELQCNGVEECSDGSDERDCEKVSWKNMYNDERFWTKKHEIYQKRVDRMRIESVESSKKKEPAWRNEVERDSSLRRIDQGPRGFFIKNDNVIGNSIEEAFPEMMQESRRSISIDRRPGHLSRTSRSKNRENTLKKSGNSTEGETKELMRKKKRRKHGKRKNPRNDSSTDPSILDTVVTTFRLPHQDTTYAVSTMNENTTEKHLSRYQKYFEKHLKKLTTSRVTTSTTASIVSSSLGLDSSENGTKGDKTVDKQMSKAETAPETAGDYEEKLKTTENRKSNINEIIEATEGHEEQRMISSSNTEETLKSTATPEGKTRTWHVTEASQTTQFTERNYEEDLTTIPEEQTTLVSPDEQDTTLDASNVTGSSKEDLDEDFETNILSEITQPDPEEVTFSTETLDGVSSRVTEGDSGSIKVIYGYKAKINGKFAKYYDKYLEGKVTPSAITVSVTPDDDQVANKTNAELENVLFESTAYNSKVNLNLLSGDRLSNEVPTNPSVSNDQTFHEKLYTCTSKCAELLKKMHEQERRKNSKVAVDEKVDTGLINSTEDDTTFNGFLDKVNCTDLELDPNEATEVFDPVLKETMHTWQPSPGVIRTTESTDLVELITETSRKKPKGPGKGRSNRGKKKERKNKTNKGKKNKTNKEKKNKRTNTTNNPLSTPIQEDTTVSVQETLWEQNRSWTDPDVQSTLWDPTTPYFSTQDTFDESSYKEITDIEEKQTDQGTTSSSEEVTDFTIVASVTRNCKKGPSTTTEGGWFGWKFHLDPASKEDCEEDSIEQSATQNLDVTASRSSTIDFVEEYTFINGGSKKLAPTTEAQICEDNQHLCDQDLCVPEIKVCDGFVDCKDITDEMDCDYYYSTRREYGKLNRTSASCEEYQFLCDGWRCISNTLVCDDVRNCEDGSDEADCGEKERECTPTQFKCLTGNKCIEGVYRCDGHPDCPDQSDEDCVHETTTHVTQPTSLPWPGWATENPRECDPSTEMRCDDGKCVLLRRKCDNIFDCLDGSDERGCGVCTPAEWKCASGECLPENERCDGIIQCADGSDEDRCVNECPAGTFRCNDGLCLNSNRRCDGRPHCLDGSDEIDCQCPNGQRPCDNHVCINKDFFCDNNPDCLDGSDERDCQSTTQPPSTRCRHDEFTCRDGSCIPQSAVCDRRIDCPHEDDEANCHRGCGKDQFQCANGECVRSEQKCNGYIDCTDGSDEPEECDRPGIHPMPGRCPAGYIMCTRDKDCVPQSSVCNGVPECRDRSDEENCCEEPSHLNLKTYPSEQVIKENPAKQGREVVFQCRDEGPLRARVRWLRGNNLPLPSGSQDVNGRLEIPNIQLDHAGPYICEAVGWAPSTAGQQVTVHLSVEKFEQPATNRPHTCQYDEATCSNGDCIPKSYVCNGRLDCTDGSDEMRCSPHGCEPNEYRCNNTQCVSKLWRCDGDKDCADGSDEENCTPNRPGSPCRFTEFACASGQCIPKSYHCDLEKDCIDGSDEIGCSPVYIIKPPPPMITLEIGAVLVITCTAIGVPTPEINWRLNWGHIPPKCTMTSINGTGVLTCPDIQVEDQGAYSCEALNGAGFVFAVPDAIVMVEKPRDICPKGMFNSEARTVEECISCFCFGVATECRSANLFTYQIPPPFDRHRFVLVEQEPSIQIVSDIGNQFAEVRGLGRDGVHLYGTEALSNELSRGRADEKVPYFALPESYHDSQLKSYGGYLKYRVRYNGTGIRNSAPSVILTGNNYVLVHRGKEVVPRYDTEESVRFFHGEWYKKQGYNEIPATREDIMMTLARVDNILIKAQYDDSPYLDLQITNIVMDTADVRNTGLGSASYVEECQCPSGYTGLSCEQCAPGYLRRESGPWLGQCYRDEGPCAPGYYGDPSRNIQCQVCPCPLTNPSNQFARTCHLGSDGQPTCDCPPGYIGRRCQQCDVGYQGNPLIPGDMCVPLRQCDPDGSLSLIVDPHTGQCRCKQYATGITCNQCKANTFNLASKNQFGCIGCFCMGISNKCVSSNWYRSDIRVSFTNSIRDFSLVELKTPDALPLVEGIRLDTLSREIVYNDFPNRGNNDVYYWQLPNIFLGNQITSYGGNLTYTVRYVPSPGGQSSRNNAADVELISANDINLLYFSRESPEANSPQTFTVPLLEQYWQRTDGTQADREHLLMALADIRAVRIKATYTTHTNEAALSLVSLDIADKYNTGRSRAVEVEECSCPAGYKGLSCEDCDVGYTRANEGLYLGICEPCNCNGHSTQCNPDTGSCENCAHYTTGEFCEVCEPGYEGDATRGTPQDCVYRNPRPPTCNCNPAGSRSSFCIGDRCDCKRNVEGPECNRCRPSTFGLSAENPDGCSECYCSGVTNQCHESSLYVQQIPVWVYDSQHGFTLTDPTRREVIDDGFELNIAMNEIGYRYPDSRGRRLFWSLPAVFTGNKVKSYGGNLTLTQQITAYPGAQSYKDQDIILIGNGITLFWTNPKEIQPDLPLTYTVPLRETEWKRLTTEGPRVASRVDLMTVLSNLEAILVRASHSERMTATYISDISLDTAVEVAGSRRAVHVEVCRCPTGYTGTSCESCARGYYRDTNDRTVSYLGSCNLCPCNKNEESCEISRTGHVKCHCLSGYTGQYCQDTGELMVSLTPMTGEVKPNTWTLFTCSYESTDPLYIYFKLSPFRDAPLTATSATPGPIVHTEKGAYRTWYVYVLVDPCNVECYIQDRTGKDLIKVVTSVTPEHSSTTISPSGPTITPPRIVVYIKGPEFQIVKTGSTVRYHCSGRALDNGPVHVRWEKEGGELPRERSVDDSRGLLIIRDVKVSDSGVYVCQVSDGVHIAFKNVTLTVGGVNPVAPRTIIVPPSLQVIEGEPAEFRCEASGNPPPHVEWIRVHGSMNPEVTTQNGVWTLRAASKNDAAEYKCIARNNIGVDERTAVLYVRDNPNKPPPTGIQPTITPPEWTGFAGEVIRITCTPSQIANVTWSREGNLPLRSSTSQRDGVLTIMNPNPYDSGIYVCTATSHIGTETSSVININVQPRRTPSVKVKPEKQTVPQGSVAEIRCLTGGEPGVQVWWSKYLEQMSPNVQQVDDTLRIVNVQISDRGVYVCKVTGPSGVHEASAMIEVEPREPPLLELYPKETQTVTLGGSADVQCRAIAGTPMPELHWSRRDGAPFPHNIKQLPGGVLRLSNITLNDGGTYICSAVNSVGSTSAVAYIEVQSVPVINISPRSGILNVKRGDRVRLVCSASGNPQPNVEWTKHVNGMAFYNRPLDMTEKTPLSAVYEIFSVSTNDEGSYTCHAVNAAGRVEERVHIRIEDDNEKGDVMIPEDYFRIPNGGKVEMRCQVYAPGGNHIYLDWKRNDHRLLPAGSTVNNGVLTIPAVDKSTAGEYVCLGMDQAGTVLFRAKSHLEVLSPPRIDLNPPRQTVGPGENPSIVCSATGDEPMTIEWAAIGRNLPYSVSHNRGILQFHGITYSDAGKYVCKATNDAGTAEAVAEVLVNEHIYEDTGVRAAQRDVVAYVGQPVRLQCTVKERATIHWSREGQPLPSNARTEDDYLELPRARPDDNGRYICQIQTAHGVSSDYINLNVSLVNLRPDCTRANQTHCGYRKCICVIQGCVLSDYRCYVGIPNFNNNHDYFNSVPQNHRYLQQRSATVMPMVSVEVSQDPVNIGDTIDIRCACTGAHNPRYHWSRPNHPSLPSNALEYDNVLRMTGVTVDDSGVYRCTAETPEGIFQQDFNLVVHGGHNDAPAIETKYAPYGSNVEMNCRPNLDPPLKFHWSKLGGLPARDAKIFESKLNLTNVKAEDAGTYICTVNNDHESIEIPTVLVVTGVVPYFSQAPESFIALPPLPDSYLRFNIEVSFKPESYDGIILYNDESSRGDGDFIMLSLVNGYPQFSFDLGSGPALIRADKPVALSEWHTIKLQRNRKEGTMLVDEQDLYSGVAGGRKQGLDLKELMFVGGVPAYNTINKHAEITSGFVGCVSRLVIGDKEVDLNGNLTDSIGITNCETCAENPCNNGGVCQEAAAKSGYTCLCRAGYSGKHCDYIGLSCYPGACGEGNCVDKETGGFDCYCPHGKTGSRCENSLKIYDPAFRDDRSFIAHDTPKALRRTRMSPTHSRLRSRTAQVRKPRSRPHHHDNLHHTKH